MRVGIPARRDLGQPASDPFGPVAAAVGVLSWLLLVTIAAAAPLF
ncbi:MAG TPA: hypothetical protein VHJ83_02545 [Micromonosporaceae bacterium]|nr:hypothetical protein [Micromonosporaceae bacterium]